MVHFSHIENFVWLLLPAMGLAVLFLYMQWRKNTLNRLADASLRKLILPGFVADRSVRNAVFILAATVLLVFALANLQAGKKPRKASQQGLDLIIAVDVSKSMDAQDIKPSRVAQARHFIQQLLRSLPQDRVGIVVFAGNAYVQMPLTSDLQAAAMFVNSISTDIAPTQGTSVTEAIGQSSRLLFPPGKTQHSTSAKIIVLISDGEDHEAGAKAAAEEAAKSGAIIYTVGAGTSQGGVIPLNKQGALLKDENGQAVISRLNPQTLQEIAEISNGKYFALGGSNTAKQIADELSGLKRGERETMVFDEYESYYQLFAALALLLLLAEPLAGILNRRKLI